MPLPIGKQITEGRPMNALVVYKEVQDALTKCMQNVNHLQVNNLGDSRINAELLWDLHQLGEKIETHTNLSNADQSRNLDP